jgi:ribosome biogenesis protein BMS1
MLFRPIKFLNFYKKLWKTNKNKSFKAKCAGRKAEKKELQDKKKRGLSMDKKNFKAFQKKPIKNLRRLLDMQERKLHVPIQNRTYGDPPPTVVAIVGPPKSGKTTLIESLLKH